MGAHRLRLPFAVVVTVVAAGVATLLLRPRGDLIEPAAVSAEAYFSQAQLERADAFRDPQRLIGLLSLALSMGALAFVALRPPRPARRALERLARRPLVGAAGAGAALSVGLTVLTLPLSAVAHARAVDVGLATQAWPAWLGDVAKSAAVGAVMAAGGAVIGVWLVRRAPRRWWLPGGVVAVAVAALLIFIQPVVIDPLFNRFEPLPPGPLRSEVLRLADRAGVEVGEVLRVDASRRTTGANAYVGGLGETKRVVLYDNLIEGFPREEVRSVVAHELAHQHHRDLLHGLAWLAIVAPAGALLVQRIAEAAATRGGGARAAAGPLRGDAAAVPALALAFAIVSFALTAAGNVTSRAVEARADAFALRLTGDPQAFIGLEQRLARRNVADVDPPLVPHLLFGTHPTTLERIGAGVAFARRTR